MSVYNDAAAYTKAVLGQTVQGKTSTITSDTTFQVFTVSGGEVLVTALYGKVTTAITDAGEDIILQVDPTTGTTRAIAQNSGDIGTADVPAGDLILFSEDNDGASQPGIVLAGLPLRFVAPIGEVELVVGTGSGAEDGVIEWYATYVPLIDGATMVASA
jgi:hypothetical protein